MCNDGALLFAKSVLAGDVHEEQITADGDASNDGPSKDQIVLYRGTILTMAGGKFNPVEAIAVQGDTIIAVGGLEEVRSMVASSRAIDRDLGTHCIAPGFIDPHLHLLLSAMVAEGSQIINMSYPHVKKRQDAIELIRNSPHHGKEGQWIIGFGYDPSLVQNHEAFLRTELDEIAPENPVYVVNQSGHLAYINSTAFRKAGIGIKEGEENFPANDENYEKAPPGVLDGVLKEDAVGTIFKHLPPTLNLDAIKNIRPTLKGWAKRGCTTVFDCGLGNAGGLGEVELLAGSISSGQFPRFRGVVTIQSVENDIDGFLKTHPSPPWAIGKVSIQGIKFWLDGSTQGLTAAVKEPYLHPFPDTPYGSLNYPNDDDLFERVLPFVKAGWQIVMHANGGRAVDQALRVLKMAVTEAAAEGSQQQRTKRYMHRLEHVTADVTMEQLKEAADLGIGVSHLIAHVRTWGKTFRDWVLGPDRAARLDPVADDVATGVTYSFHSDSPVSAVAPLRYVDTAVTRRLEDGGEILGEDQRIGLEEAFRGITYNPAKQLGVLEEVGTLEVMKKADFVILKADPRRLPEGELYAQCEVLETWVGGLQIWKEGE